jgi:hypothetical protein
VHATCYNVWREFVRTRCPLAGIGYKVLAFAITVTFFVVLVLVLVLVSEPRNFEHENENEEYVIESGQAIDRLSPPRAPASWKEAYRDAEARQDVDSS